TELASRACQITRGKGYSLDDTRAACFTICATARNCARGLPASNQKGSRQALKPNWPRRHALAYALAESRIRNHPHYRKISKPTRQAGRQLQLGRAVAPKSPNRCRWH